VFNKTPQVKLGRIPISISHAKGKRTTYEGDPVDDGASTVIYHTAFGPGEAGILDIRRGGNAARNWARRFLETLRNDGTALTEVLSPEQISDLFHCRYVGKDLKRKDLFKEVKMVLNEEFEFLELELEEGGADEKGEPRLRGKDGKRYMFSKLSVNDMLTCLDPTRPKHLAETAIHADKIRQLAEVDQRILEVFAATTMYHEAEDFNSVNDVWWPKSWYLLNADLDIWGIPEEEGSPSDE
jgi:hypothetical protein